jgi:glycosyltransferase involved in cell wall biosynthesis
MVDTMARSVSDTVSAPAGERRTVIWVSTSLTTRGGISSFVRTMSATPLFSEWDIEHVATHRDGSTFAKVTQFLGSLPRLVWHLAVDRPALVHIHVASNGSFVRKFVVNVIARAFRVPVVTHVHGGMFHEFYSAAPTLVQRAVRSMLASSGAVIALGASWAERLQSIQPKADVMSIPNIARVRGMVAQPAQSQPVEVLFLGRVSDQKGTFALLEAWQRITSETTSRRPAHLTIAGDGEVARARRVVLAGGIADSVHVTGWMSAEDVEERLARSHVLVLPSHVEGQPMSILEAMGHGLCVIASHAGGIPEMIGEAGVLVDAGDVDGLTAALRDVVDDEAIRVRLGTAALTRARENFDADVVWRRFDRLYHEVGRR